MDVRGDRLALMEALVVSKVMVWPKEEAKL